jgi:hypothetical protein
MPSRANLLAAILACTCALSFAGCMPQPEHQALRAFMQQKGLNVSNDTHYSHVPFFTPPGFDLLVEDKESVQVYEYPNSASANNEAKGITKDGIPVSISQWKWGAPPHFYWATTSIILYVGKDERIMQLLEERYGQPFAEGK